MNKIYSKTKNVNNRKKQNRIKEDRNVSPEHLLCTHNLLGIDEKKIRNEVQDTVRFQDPKSITLASRQSSNMIGT